MTQPLRHIMLDLETLGTGKDACIASIGACLFDPDTGYVPNPGNMEGVEGLYCFHEIIDLEGSSNIGTIDPGTVMWWMRQSDAARESLFGEGVVRTDLGHALSAFSGWLQTNGLNPSNRREWCLWANDPDFDVAILISAFVRHGIAFPLPYNSSRSMRTMRHLSQRYELEIDQASVPANVLQHNALADAIYQAWVVNHIFDALDGIALNARA